MTNRIKRLSIRPLSQHLFLLLAVLSVFIAGKTEAQNIMQIHDASVASGQQVTISISIANTVPFVGFQLDIPLPGAFSYVANSAALNPARSNGHMFSASLINNNSTLRIIGFSTNNTPFVGNSGEVANFKLLAGTVPGSYPLTINSALISDAGGLNIMTNAINGTLTLQAPNIQVSPPSQDFGNNPLGTFADREVNIQNTGNLPLEVTGINFDSPYFENLGSGSFTLPAGQSTTRTIRFHANEKGTYNKLMSIHSNDPDQGVSTVNLQAIAFAVNELHCGNMQAASGTQQTLSLSINNMEAFVGFQFDLSLPSTLTYVSGSTSLNPSRRIDHQVTVSMLNTSTLRVIGFSVSNQAFLGNDGVVISLNFEVNGTGGWYPLSLGNIIIGDEAGNNIISASYGGGLTITSPDIDASNSINFGNVAVNASSSQNLTINNYGEEALTISAITFTNPVYSTLISLPITIEPWNSQQVSIDFQPQTTGQTTGQMRIFSDDPDENPFNVSLSAYAFSPNYLTVSTISASPGTTVTLPISAENYDPFVGFQFDLVLPEGVSYISSSAVLNPARKQDHIVSVNTLQNGAIRILAFSFQQLPFSGSQGDVVTIGLFIDEEADFGNLPLDLSNTILGNSLSQNILWGVNSGNLNITALNAVGVNILFEGAFDGSEMQTILNDAGRIPLSQPYSPSPWNYNGSESVPQIPAGVVDWVLVEFRDAVSAETATTATTLPGWPKAMFIKQDGSITDSEGRQPGILSSAVQNNLYIVIRHRNHLDVMSSAPLSLSGNTYSYDFTDAVTKAYGGAAGYKQIGTGVYGMVAGDIDADGAVFASDFNIWAINFGLTTVYLPADVDMDGQVFASDFNKWAVNFGTNTGKSGSTYRSMVPE